MNPLRLYLTFIIFILLRMAGFSQAAQVTVIPGLGQVGFAGNATAFIGNRNLKIETGPQLGFYT